MIILLTHHGRAHVRVCVRVRARAPEKEREFEKTRVSSTLLPSLLVGETMLKG